jgi:transglutaminase-like putative cysteine protease
MLRLLATAVLLATVSNAQAQTAPAQQTRTYRVRQTVSLAEVPDGAKKLRWWIAIPSDDRAQEVLDMTVVSAPGTWSVQREAEHGNRFLYVEADKPSAGKHDTVVEFTLRRRPIRVAVDPTKEGTLSDAERAFFVDELRTDAPHMQVTDAIRATANKVCGDTRDFATQASKLLQHVAATADHYSKDPSKPKCGVGDAQDCLTNGGGCCTDLHSLFIALSRARGIPTRLQMGYRLLAKNEGKEVDPGYRCWPEYFVPGYGWVPADVVEADAVTGDESRAWLTGLSERRLWLNEGREFELVPRQAGPRVNTMVNGYAEIDGKPARVLPEGERPAQLTRTVLFQEIPEGASTAIEVGPVK